MRILFVVEHFYPYVGGAEELFLNLTVSLSKAGYEIHVITTLHEPSLKKYEEYKGVKIIRVNCFNRFLFTVMSIPAIIRLGKKADFIHTTSYNSAIPSFVAGLILNKKVLITFHEVWGKMWLKLPFTPKWKLMAFYVYEWFILKLPFYKYIAVSEYTKDSLVSNGIPSDKVVKIYNGVNYEILAPYRHHPPDNFTFCFFGRLGISKGINILLQAAKSFILNHPEAKLKLIIPTYPEALFNKIIQSIKKLQLEENLILFHNLSKERLLDEVSRSSCVVIPSYSEGFCFVAVESIGMKVPVISSGRGALQEVVSGDHINLQALESETLISALENAYRKKWVYKDPVHFTLNESVSNHITFYNSLQQAE